VLTREVDCTIARRLLVNYRVEPEVLALRLPEPFRPQIVSGWGVAGVCFIALVDLRPVGIPAGLGFNSENVAHRFAVEWDDDDGRHLGVYVPRRDSGSRVISWSGGRVFPGRHGLARFEVEDSGEDLHIEVLSRDRAVRLEVKARTGEAMSGELFGSMVDATSFFRAAPIGYSPTGDRNRCDGVRLLSEHWEAEPATVSRMRSNLFDDKTKFPPGTCTLDSALVMRNLPVRWVSQGPVHSPSLVGAH
jgi:Uncharacterized conserved protein (COG2071)